MLSNTFIYESRCVFEIVTLFVQKIATEVFNDNAKIF